MLIACGGSGNQPSLNADAGADLQVNGGDDVQLVAADSEEGFEYSWQQISGPLVELVNSDNSIAVFTAPSVFTESQLEFRLSVTAGDEVAIDDIAITVFPPLANDNISGLDRRLKNESCLAGAAPVNDAGAVLTRVFQGLPDLNQPLAMVQAPGDSEHWFIVEREGRILRFDNREDVNSYSEVLNIIDIVDSREGDSGLLDLAFHPDFANNGEVYVYFQRAVEPRLNTLARFTSLDGGETLDPSSLEIIAEYDPPVKVFNHHGGRLQFGDDGYLYLSVGDGGFNVAGDPENRAQNTQLIFGSIIRIDVDAEPYGIPIDNPFAGNDICQFGQSVSGQDCPEIFAWGLRNPWRWSFDLATGDLWLGDVGQNTWEEINFIEMGQNYGWPIKEGFNCHRPSTGCDETGLTDPVVALSRSEGASVTGGYVYRGGAIESLAGKYVFGDFVSGTIWTLTNVEGQWQQDVLLTTTLGIASFAQDNLGELFVIDLLESAIYKITPDDTSGGIIPQLLSQTGCVDPSDPSQPAAALIPYEVSAPFWSDSAEKQRWIALPDDGQITLAQEGDFEFPIGTVLMKHFWLDDRLVETRLFMLHTEDLWQGYSYEWNESQTEAVRVIGGKNLVINNQDWSYPSSADCQRCHTSAAGHALGPESGQLNTTLLYPQTGRERNQLETLMAIGALDDSPDDVIEIPDPNDTMVSVEQRAKAYLHTNCSQCHRPNGPTNVDMDLRFSATLADMEVCDIVPQNGDLDIVDARRLSPGNSSGSVLLQRMNRRGEQQMPPITSNLIDEIGVSLVAAWIDSLSGCP